MDRSCSQRHEMRQRTTRHPAIQNYYHTRRNVGTHGWIYADQIGIPLLMILPARNNYRRATATVLRLWHRQEVSAYQELILSSGKSVSNCTIANRLGFKRKFNIEVEGVKGFQKFPSLLQV